MADTSPRSKTAGFARGCLSLVSAWVLLSVAGYMLMTPVRPAVLRAGMAVLSALFLTLGLGNFWYVASGELGGHSLRTLIRRARKGEPPQDGEPVVAEGVVRSLSSPLTAPLSGVACAAYWYKMYYMARSMGRARRIAVPVYWGYACRPFAIDSSVARLRVLAVPLPLHGAAESRQGPDVLERARRLVATTGFEPVVGEHLLGTLGTVFELARDTFSDEDGEARRDWKREGDERDPETLLLEETLLPVGATASAHGHWSAERGAIVSEGSALGATVSVTLGRAEMLKRAPGIGHSVGGYLVSATLFTALGAGLLWFSVSILATRL